MNNNNSIWMFDGSKGGSGKSMACIKFVHYLKQRGLDPFVIDTDHSNPDVYKIYIKEVGRCHNRLFDMGKAQGWLDCFALAKSMPDRPIVINCGAVSIVGAEEHGAAVAYDDVIMERLRMVWVATEKRDSMELLIRFQEALPTVPVYVVLNEFHGEDFPMFETVLANKMIKIVEAMKMKVLVKAATAHLQNDRMGIDAVLQNPEIPGILRGMTTIWSNEMDKRFDKLLGW